MFRTSVRYAGWLGWVLWLGMAPGWLCAQGVLLDEQEGRPYRLPRPIWPHPPHPPHPRPVPEPTYRIQELGVQVSLEDQLAKVQVSQTFVNTGSRPLEVSFLFPLPYDGAVDQMTFMVDGKEYAARLLTATDARRLYEGYVRKNQDPALLEWVGTGLFKTSVFPVPPGAKRQVTLKFSQLCRQQGGLTELLFPLSTAKYTSEPIDQVSIRVQLQSRAKIKNLYSPSHALDIKRSSDHQATISYTGTKEIPSTDFRLLYDVGEQPVGANVVSYRPRDGEDGYFILLATPEVQRPANQTLSKTVVFVVDRSGSMSGKKIEQAQGALRFVLNNLREGDLFNIIAYDSTVESFRPELQRFNQENRQAALGYVEGLHAGGSTNLDGALQAALRQFQDEKQANYLVFLTDGLPTVGERNEAKIAELARANNKTRTRIFSFGVGYDVNSRLLDKLSRNGFGQSHYVRPNEDLEEHVSRLYHRIGAPALTNVSIQFDLDGFPAERGSVANRIYPREVPDLFAGDQLVLVGRYQRGGAARLTIRGSSGGTQHEFHFPVQLAEHSADETLAFAEKLWALRRVGEIIDEIDLRGKNQELVDELVALATRHGIVTPYTSFLADETASIHDLAANRRQAGVALDSLQKAEGISGFVQRDIKNQFQRATNAAPATASAPAAAGGRSPAGMGGLGAPAIRTLATDEVVQITNVRQLGNKTFYRRNQRWIDSTITPEQERSARQITRFSPEYFELVQQYGKEIGQYTADDEPITLVLGGQAYSF